MLPLRGGCRPLQPTRPTPHWHRRQAVAPAGFGLLPVRSPLLRESSLFLGVLRCFSSPGALSWIPPEVPGRAPGGLPHSDIPGSLAASASPGHFAAWPRPSSAANAKASTMRPSCVFLLLLPSGVCRGHDSRPARASGMAPSAAAPTRCPACAVPRWVVYVFLVLCCFSVRAGDQTRASQPHQNRCGTGLGSRDAHQGHRRLPRPQNPTGSAWRIVKVPTTHQSSIRRPSGRREVVKPRQKPSAGLGRDLPTRWRSGDRGWHAGTTTGVKHPGWSRGDSNPGPPPCKGGALPAKLRPQVVAPTRRPHKNDSLRVGAPGLEPGTSALSGPRSNRLSYAPAACPPAQGNP